MAFSQLKQELGVETRLSADEKTELKNVFDMLRNIKTLKEELEAPAHKVASGVIRTIIFELRALIQEEYQEKSLINRFGNINGSLPVKIGRLYQNAAAAQQERQRRTVVALNRDIRKIIDDITQKMNEKGYLLYQVGQEIQAFENFANSGNYVNANAQLDRIGKQLRSVVELIIYIQKRIQQLESLEIRETQIENIQVPKLQQMPYEYRRLYSGRLR
ncbi:MAG TPA: hypothetical protein VJ110_03485 [Candidatus Nanoarchaeia archaeon]|nr:hypothetical protein [Candidatus Nanoarchaeia archaeon]